MTIDTSVIQSQVIQPDGSINVTEIHTDHQGVKYPVVYNAPSGTNLTTFLNAHAILLENNLRDSDIFKAIFTEPWDYTLVHATNNELAVRARALYKESIMIQTALIGLRITEWIDNDRFTVTQVRNAFGLSLAQWNTLRTKINGIIADYQGVQGAAGE